VSANRKDLKARMAVAATRRAEPETPAAGQTAVRTKPVRITVDLSPADYQALNHWLGSATIAVDAAPGQRVTLSKAIRAMINATILDQSIGLVVIDLLRQASEQR